MPLYEYQCTACSHQFEALQKMTSAPLTECPECKKTSLVKQIPTGHSFSLNGDGFFKQGMA